MQRTTLAALMLALASGAVFSGNAEAQVGAMSGRSVSSDSQIARPNQQSVQRRTVVVSNRGERSRVAGVTRRNGYSHVRVPNRRSVIVSGGNRPTVVSRSGVVLNHSGLQSQGARGSWIVVNDRRSLERRGVAGGVVVSQGNRTGLINRDFGNRQNQSVRGGRIVQNEIRGRQSNRLIGRSSSIGQVDRFNSRVTVSRQQRLGRGHAVEFGSRAVGVAPLRRSHSSIGRGHVTQRRGHVSNRRHVVRRGGHFGSSRSFRRGGRRH